MDQYSYLGCLISQFEKANVFSKKLLDQLNEELETARKDGRLDDDSDYASFNIMFCNI